MVLFLSAHSTGLGAGPLPRAQSEPSGWKDSHTIECQAFLVLDSVWGSHRADEKTEAQSLNDLMPKDTYSRVGRPRPVPQVPVPLSKGGEQARSSEEGARQRSFLPVEGHRAALMTHFPRSSNVQGPGGRPQCPATHLPEPDARTS